MAGSLLERRVLLWAHLQLLEGVAGMRFLGNDTFGAGPAFALLLQSSCIIGKGKGLRQSFGGRRVYLLSCGFCGGPPGQGGLVSASLCCSGPPSPPASDRQAACLPPSLT